MDAFNIEASKLAAMGTTIIVATGDDGVASNISDMCLCNIDSSSESSSWKGNNTWQGKGYFPSFPATSPWVTAIGATTGPLHQMYVDIIKKFEEKYESKERQEYYSNLIDNIKESNNERMIPLNLTDMDSICTSQIGCVITSAGGFSTYFKRPNYQNQAVNKYFNFVKDNIIPIPFEGYNIEGRAIPDISLTGINYQVVLDNKFVSLFGTSCSAPLLASMITRINTEREKKGLPSVGFINPTLYSFGYKNIEVLLTNSYLQYTDDIIFQSNMTSGIKETNFVTQTYKSSYFDITKGFNGCCASSNPKKSICCESGFYAGPEWDPVSGWGSIDYPTLAGLFNITMNFNYNLNVYKHPDLNKSGASTLQSIFKDEKKNNYTALLILVAVVTACCAVVLCLSKYAKIGSPYQHDPYLEDLYRNHLRYNVTSSTTQSSIHSGGELQKTEEEKENERNRTE